MFLFCPYQQKSYNAGENCNDVEVLIIRSLILKKIKTAYLFISDVPFIEIGIYLDLELISFFMDVVLLFHFIFGLVILYGGFFMFI